MITNTVWIGFYASIAAAVGTGVYRGLTTVFLNDN